MLLTPSEVPAVSSVVDSTGRLGLCGLLRKNSEQYLNLLEALEKDEADGVALNLKCLAEQLRQITPRLRDQENRVITMLTALRDAKKVISLRGTLVARTDYKEFANALSDYQKQLMAYDVHLDAEMRKQEMLPKKGANINQLRSKVVEMINSSRRSNGNERKESKCSLSNEDPTLLDLKEITKSNAPHHESRERPFALTLPLEKLDEVAPDKQPIVSNDDYPRVPFDLNLLKQNTIIACAKEKRSDVQDPASSWFRFAYGSRILCCLLFLSACFCSFHIVNAVYSSIITAVDDCEAANTLCKRFNTCCFSICGANRLNILLSKLITINIESNIS